MTKAQMHPVTPAGRKRMVVLVFGEVGDPKATCPRTTLEAGAKAREPGDSTIRYA